MCDEYFFETGMLQLVADNGDYLRISPYPDDETLADIEISNGNGVVKFQESWKLCQENLAFSHNLLR